MSDIISLIIDERNDFVDPTLPTYLEMMCVHVCVYRRVICFHERVCMHAYTARVLEDHPYQLTATVVPQ